MPRRILTLPILIILTIGAGYAASYGELPLRFEANLGQSHADVRFLCRGSGYTLFLTRSSCPF